MMNSLFYAQIGCTVNDSFCIWRTPSFMSRLDVLLTIHFVYDELPLLYVLMFCTYYTNYSLFFPCFQEPTSGLDASTALSIMQQMKVFATTYNKTIITSIHQPSSQIFHMFNNMLLLINGQVSLYTILTSLFLFV